MLDNPALQDCQENNGFGDMMDEDVMNNVSVRLKLSLTVWDFTLPMTPSLPAVFGVSWQSIPFYIYIHFHLCTVQLLWAWAQWATALWAHSDSRPAEDCFWDCAALT